MKTSVYRNLLAAAALALTATNAGAAGLWLYESGTPDMGTANAGSAAMARDAATATYNPAGMTRLDRSQLMVGALALDIQSRFNGQTTRIVGPVDTSGNGHNAGNFTPLASLNYVYVASPDLRFGVSLGSYFGLGLDYGDTWMGRYYVQKAEFLTMGLNPSVAYKINDWLSVGGGATILYGEFTQEAAVNNLGLLNPNDGKLKIKSDDVGYGYNFGVLLEPGKDTRIGITYRSKIDLKFNDTPSAVGVTGPIGSRIADIINGGSIGLGMTIPQAVTVSAYEQLSDQWAVMASVGWQAWSQFGNVSADLSTPAVSGSRAINAGFDDTWHGAFGAHYRIAEPWLLMAGFAYDTSPVKDEKRTAALALDRQIRYATGVEYSVNKDITVGFAYTFVDLGKAKVNQNRGPLAGNLVGEFSTNYVSAYGLNMNWKF